MQFFAEPGGEFFIGDTVLDPIARQNDILQFGLRLHGDVRVGNHDLFDGYLQGVQFVGKVTDGPRKSEVPVHSVVLHLASRRFDPLFFESIVWFVVE